jgi:hypothetical protein
MPEDIWCITNADTGETYCWCVNTALATATFHRMIVYLVLTGRVASA